MHTELGDRRRTSFIKFKIIYFFRWEMNENQQNFEFYKKHPISVTLSIVV